MTLVLADLRCAHCGEALTATIPLVAIDIRIGCAVCGKRRVRVEPFHAALPIPHDSALAANWRFNMASDPVLERAGGRWHPC